MVKIAAVSDLHGYLPEIPKCDILLVAGDINGASDIFSQMKFMCGPFKQWLREVPAEKKIIVAGNHDIIFEKCKELLPQWDDDTHYLQDDGVELFGLKIYGSPWQIRFCDWAFNEDEHNLVYIWEKIPDDTDVLVTHSPPYGYGDADRAGTMLGSPSLTHRILNVQPKLSCWGHIHDGYSNKPYMIKNTMGFNVSLCTNSYKPTNSPIIVDL